MNDRPNPEVLLGRITAHEKKAQRGKLKIFFGACAGVGKTFAMLSAAQQAMREGIDVAVGIVETHGRPETQNLVKDLPVIPPIEIDHRGIKLREFNLDAAKARKPAILLLDELAHTNAPDMRHPKRWQDVQELLDAGIDVYTTLNVQHLESLNDLVAGNTGVWVKETVPDSIFDEAEDIILIDINADDILKRLKAGKVYIAPQAKANAAENFFKKNNLIALRELALRRTAERVDAQMGDYNIRQGIKNVIPISDKILVCIGPDPLSAKLVRSTKRLANALKAPWTAVYVENKRHLNLNDKAQRSVQALMRVAERNGGQTVILQGSNAAEEIMAYAQANNVTKIVIGKPYRPLWKDYLYGSLADKVIHKSGDIDVYVITGKEIERQELQRRKNLAHFNVNSYLWAAFAVAISTGIAKLLDSWLEPIDLIMIYLAGVITVAAKWGRGPAILYSFLSVTAFNFFFIDPLHTFAVYDSSYWITFMVMIGASFVISTQATQLHEQAVFARKRAADIQNFFNLTRELASIRGHKKISEAAIAYIENVFNVQAAVWLDEGDQHLQFLTGTQFGDHTREITVAQWAFDNNHNAGRSTNTMPSAVGLYLPLTATYKPLGILGVTPKTADRNFDPEEILRLETFASLLASSLERANAAENAEKLKIEAEGEKMRSMLFSSVSHDLRTPLASIIGSSSSIMTDANKLTKETIKELAKSVNSEANRLSRIVTNLLDLTRLESGKVKLNKQPYFIEEIIGSVLSQMKPVLAEHQVFTRVKPDLPMVMIDGTMIEQVLFNLLENAAKYTPAKSVITVSAIVDDNELKVTVSDNGPGIKKGDERKIFDKFYTSELPGAKKGTGLGLSICNSIIMAHQGRIWAENMSSGGAMFSFTLPLEIKNDIKKQ